MIVEISDHKFHNWPEPCERDSFQGLDAFENERFFFFYYFFCFFSNSYEHVNGICSISHCIRYIFDMNPKLKTPKRFFFLFLSLNGWKYCHWALFERLCLCLCLIADKKNPFSSINGSKRVGVWKNVCTLPK